MTPATATLDFAKPHVLRNVREFRAAVAELDTLLDARRGTERYERLRFLSVLVEAYEAEHEAFNDTATPQEVVEFMREQKGMTRTELSALLGGRSRASDFFNGKRRLSLGQSQALREALGISADLLLGEVP